MGAPEYIFPPPTTGGTPVGGSGTVGTIPVWGTTTTTLTDSPLTVSGTTVTATQAFTVNGTHTFNGNLVSGFNQTWTLNGGFLNIQSGLLYLDKTNSRIGIGTASPRALLDLKAASAPKIKFGEVVDGTPNYATGYVATVRDGGSGYKGALVFATGDNGDNAIERARIDSTGNVGIGTTSPGRKLEISSAAPLRMGTGGEYFDFIQYTTGTWALFSSAGQYVTAWKTSGGVGFGGIVAPQTNTLDVSTSGWGLKLPATPGNADVQALDCYQEVTNWVPTVTFGTGGTVSYTVHTGYYVRVGRLVTFALRVDFTVTAAPTGGDLQITLPVASAVDQYFGSGNFNSLPGSGTQGPLYVSVGVSSTANIRKASATGGSSIASAITASSTFIVTGTYIS